MSCYAIRGSGWGPPHPPQPKYTTMDVKYIKLYFTSVMTYLGGPYEGANAVCFFRLGGECSERAKRSTRQTSPSSQV